MGTHKKTADAVFLTGSRISSWVAGILDQRFQTAVFIKLMLVLDGRGILFPCMSTLWVSHVHVSI